MRHANIVKPYGFIENTAEDVAWIILPWQANGNVREFIRSGNWEIPERLSLVCPTVALTNEFLTYSPQIYDIACGVEYLHSRETPICHGDLKSVSPSISKHAQD